MPRTGETRGSEEQRVVRDELDRPCRPVVRRFALTLRPRVWARRLISGYRPTLSQGARDSRWTARDQPHRSFPLRTQPLRTGLNPSVRAYRDCSRVIRLPALHTPDGRGRLYSSRFVQIQRCSIWGRYCEFGRFAPPVREFFALQWRGRALPPWFGLISPTYPIRLHTNTRRYKVASALFGR